MNWDELLGPAYAVPSEPVEESSEPETVADAGVEKPKPKPRTRKGVNNV
jgi:hypothetical protein